MTLTEPLLEGKADCGCSEGVAGAFPETHSDALLFQQTRLVPSLHVGVALVVFALCSLAFGTAVLVVDAVSPTMSANGWPLGLRIFSLALTAVTTLLAALMLRADCAECAMRVRLGRTVALAMLGSAGAIGYALLFERDLMLAGGGVQGGVLGELASTACLACFSVLLLVWNIAHTITLRDDAEECCIDEDSEAAEGCGDETTPTPPLDQAALLKEAEAAAARAIRSMEGAPPRVSGSRALRELSLRHPLILCGLGLLAFAATTATFSAAQVVCGAMSASFAAAAAADQNSTVQANSLYAAMMWDGLPVPDGFIAPHEGLNELPPSAMPEQADDSQAVGSLLLTIATLFVGAVVLREEKRACVVPPPEEGLRTASMLGVGTSIFTLAYISLSPGGAALASSICTAAFSIALLGWNAVRMFLPAEEEEEEEEEQQLLAIGEEEEEKAAVLVAAQCEAASQTE